MVWPIFLWLSSSMVNHRLVKWHFSQPCLTCSGQVFFTMVITVYHRFVKWHLSQPWLTTLWPSFLWPWLTMHWPSFLTKLWQSFNPALPGCLHTMIELRHVLFHKPMVEAWSKVSMSTLQPHQNNITWRWIEQDSMAGAVTMESLKLR